MTVPPALKHLSFNCDLYRPETVIVLGVGRGGTSVVAGTLRCLGVCMGIDPHPVKHEWSPVVYDADYQVNAEATRAKIEAMNSAHTVWGWKSPSDFFVFDTVLAWVRGPAFVIVTRDVTEATMSAENYDQTPSAIGFYENAMIYQKIADRLRFWPHPAVVVPFQEILANREAFVEFLCSFLQIVPTAEQRQNAIDFSSPRQTSYRTIDENAPTTISLDDLQMDSDNLASVYIERYTAQYLGHVAGLRSGAEVAMEMLCTHLENVPKPDLVEALVAGTRQAFMRFAADLPQRERPPAERLDGMPGVDEMIAEIARAADTLGHQLTHSHVSPTESRRLLRQLHRIMLLMITVLIELQKALQVFAPARTPQAEQEIARVPSAI